MQRNITYNQFIKTSFFFILAVVYLGFSNIFLWLPPLLGLTFLLFVYSLEHERFDYLIFIFLYLLVFELEKGFLLFSSSIFFIFMYKFFLPKIRIAFDSRVLINYLCLVATYAFFILYAYILNQVLWLEASALFDWHFIYYILIEALIISLL